MPGSLASWLDDDCFEKRAKGGKKDGLYNRVRAQSRGSSSSLSSCDGRPQSPPGNASSDTPPRLAVSPGPETPVVKMSVPTSDVAASAEGEPSGSKLSSRNVKKDSWDPFTADSPGTLCSRNAFARLLQGRSSASKTSTPPCTERSLPPPAPWDPFGSNEGKENRGTNAFSKMLASSKNVSSGAGASKALGGKRKRSCISLSPDASGAAAATRFCECPICGKRVIIDLCSKHLDSECDGHRSASERQRQTPGMRERGALSPTGHDDAGVTSSPARKAYAEPVSRPAEDLSAMTSTVHPLQPAGTRAPRERQKTNNSLPEARTASPPTLRSVITGDTHVVGSVASLESTAPASRSGASCSSINIPDHAPRRKTPGLRSGSMHTKQSRNCAASDGTTAMTACPVCGKHVIADMCSLHLDTDCAGVGTTGETAGKVEVQGKAEGSAAGQESDAAATEAAETEQETKSRMQGEAAAGLMALAAELTCPICLCLFEDAHVLPCSHRFCLDCIQGCFRSSKKQECPLCKRCGWIMKKERCQQRRCCTRARLGQVPAWKRDLKRDVPLRNILSAYRRMTT